MSDFKFSDEPLSYGGRKKKGNGVDKKFFVVIISALLIGLVVFIITFVLFGPKKQVKPSEPPVTSTSLQVDSDIVKGLYSYVYNSHTLENDKFIQNKNVTIDDFSKNEIFYYALYFISSSDLVSLDEEGSTEKTNQYLIDYQTMKQCIQYFFGPSVKFDNNVKLHYVFSFFKNGYNAGTISYDTARSSFLVELNEKEETTKSVIPPFLRGLSKATQSSDGVITLTENIVYLSSEKKNDKYHIQVYQDYEKTILQEEFDITDKELEEEPLSIEKYSSVGSTIIYTFRQDDTSGSVYFESSKIQN